MPLSINVGLSRKASKDYQSTGYSINVTAELDQALLTRPDELQRQIGDLYSQTEQALARQADRSEPNVAPPARRPYTNGRPDGYRSRNGNGRRSNSNDGGMTASQRRAITAIADRLGVDPNQEAIDIMGGELAALTVRQASELIDHLKGLNPFSNADVPPEHRVLHLISSYCVRVVRAIFAARQESRPRPSRSLPTIQT